VKVSVIICTYNPAPALLQLTLESLGRQTMTDFELLLVDNNSTPPVAEAELQRRYRLNLRVLREARQGLTYARCTGIAGASGDLLVFVDDDNQLDPDYLEQALRIEREEPRIGHFGGIARPGLPKTIPQWKHKLLPHLGVRDYGPEPITSDEPRWGHWEPIGAGMVARRSVAEHFVRLVAERNAATLLGRQGRILMSGEDTLMARAANLLGYSCSYQPRLKLTHFMKPSRLKASTLARTIEGHGRSYVVLERILDRPVDPPSLSWIVRELPLRLLHRVRYEGLATGAITWFWDIGYFREARRPR
jgi:glycosyltransferase involved in cell wall biosynthesis